MSTNLVEREVGLRAARAPFVLATVVRAERPTSAKPGDRALVLADGTIEGFVGGTCAESTVRAQSLRLLDSDNTTALLRITPTEEPEQVVNGMITVGNPCLSGGTLEIFLEAMVPPPLVHVFGTAPIARALAEVARAGGFDVRESVDPVEPIPSDATAAVVASHGRDEEAMLAAALRAGVPYVALVASPRRGAAVLSALDVPPEDKARIRTPAGLDIGARTPGEVSVSILAEIIQRRPRRSDRVTVAAGPVEMATDPVCGMAVAVAPASLRLAHEGRTFYFCGPGCRQAFADNPDQYAQDH